MRNCNRGAGRQFVDSLLETVQAHPEARLRMLSRLAQWGGTTVYLPVVSFEENRAAAARKLLASGMMPAEAADAIRKRFGCSLRTAQRSVKKSGNRS